MDVFPTSRLEQRKLFYEQEFSFEKIQSFFPLMPQFLVFDFGSKSRVSKHPQKSVELLPPSLPHELLKERAMRDVPESIHYDRNLYKDPKTCTSCLQFSRCFSCPFENFLGQELVFDIPAAQVKCVSCKHGQMCPSCIDLAYRHALRLRDELLQHFESVRVVVTGDGAQVHVADHAARVLSFENRMHLYKQFEHRFPIKIPDGPEDRLSRLPYSLNGVTSRKVVPLTSNMDPVSSEKVLPSFLKTSRITHY